MEENNPVQRSEAEEIRDEFLVESREGLELLAQRLVQLEANPGDKGAISEIFRIIHTIKGASSFLGFKKIEALAHKGESLLDLLRADALKPDSAIITCLLDMEDALRKLIGAVEIDGTEGAFDFSALVARLQASQTPAAAPSAALAAAAPAPVVVLPAVAPAAVVAVSLSPAPAPAAVPVALEPAPAAAPEPAPAPAEAVPAASAEAAGAAGEGGALQTLRIDVKLLDRLMNLVGELVLTRNQMMQFSAKDGETGFQAAAQRLMLVTSELQEGMLKTRMQPIANIWGKFPRMVRDLSLTCKKKVRVLMEGQDTEVDKTIIEALRDPMIHMVRNAVDHGIEGLDARAAAGKPAEGTLHLKAFHAGGQVIIEIMDDGAGIDVARVRAKVVEKGLRTAAAVKAMSEEEVLQLVFLPGFSTNSEVTSLSGRGVGMDVVKTNIERIGGTVELASRRGVGCTVRLKIPLTLAIIPALIVRSGGEIFAIPQVNLLELVRREGQDEKAGIERVHSVPVYRLRGKLLPIVDLNKVFGLESDSNRATTNIVVLRAEDRDFGLIVDQVLDTEEIVVKALDKQLKRLGNYAGATIMGDGHVAMILDVVGLARQAHVLTDISEHHAAAALKAKEGDASKEDLQTLLVFRLDEQSRMALPLSHVDRLEEFAREKVERTSRGAVVQYRGRIMPLIDLAGYFKRGRAELPEILHVIVVSREGESRGFIVERILDIMPGVVPPQNVRRRRGTLGATVIQKKVTDLIDVAAIVEDDERAAIGGAEPAEPAGVS